MRFQTPVRMVFKKKSFICIKMLFLIILLTSENLCVKAISELSDTEYGRMPPINHMDRYESCLQRRGDMYCMAHFTLVSDGPSDLLAMIHEYSEDTATHLNHSNLRYGLCLAERCEGYYTRHATVSTKLLEACLNSTIGEKYDLQTKINEFSCTEYNEIVEKDFGDICMGLIVFVIVCLTISGTFLDIFLPNIHHKDHPIFLNFSVRHNWRRLTAPYESVTDTNRKIFKSLHGTRVVLVSLVVLGHSRMPYVTTATNLKLIEDSYKDILLYIFINGNIIIQAHFVISGMLLVYKLSCMRDEIDYHFLPKAIAARWLRLVPPHAFVLLLTATLFRHIKYGPMWEAAIGNEISDCQQRGWLGLLYLNNFLFDSQCLIHTWYLAADMQLYCFGLVLYLMAKNKSNRNLLLLLAFLVGLLIPAVITYVRNLNALVISSPTPTYNLFATDPEFNEVYRNSYTNMSSYVIGLTLGYLIYDLQRSNFKINKYKKYRYVYWATIPASLIPMLVGSIFYHGPPKDPMFIRMLYATFAKPFFGLLVAILIFGFVFKYENIYRGFVEWDGWLVPSRLSYCVFIGHFQIVRLYTASRTELIEISSYTNERQKMKRINATVDAAAGSTNGFKRSLVLLDFLMVTGFIASGFLVALPLWFLVEAPFTGLIEFYVTKRRLTIHNFSTDHQDTLKTEKTKYF